MNDYQKSTILRAEGERQQRTIPATIEGVKSIIGDMSHEPYFPEDK
ncbi:hypothetical protein [Tumidithrix helvetica]